jgi:hypothetical protein
MRKAIETGALVERPANASARRARTEGGPRSAPAIIGLAMLALAGIAGCGGGVSSVRHDERSDLQRELAIEEARLERAEEELETLEPAACPDRCRVATSICDASSRICVIARDLGDEHTMSRCDRAEALCREAHEVTSACGCEGAPVDAGTV